MTISKSLRAQIEIASGKNEQAANAAFGIFYSLIEKRFATNFNRYCRSIWRGIQKADLEDIMMEVVAGMYTDFRRGKFVTGHYSTEADLENGAIVWMLRKATRLIQKRWRENKKRNEVYPGEEMARISISENEALGASSRPSSVMNKLSERDQALITFYYVGNGDPTEKQEEEFMTAWGFAKKSALDRAKFRAVERFKNLVLTN